MSETKFTPGPWTIKSWDIGDDEMIVAPCEVWSSDVCVVATEGGLAPGTDDWMLDTIEANAALISAAPELYEALWGLREAFRGQDICDCQGSPDCPITMAEKALAKARGEAS